MKASELIQELVIQIAQYGDMDINVMTDSGYHGNVSVSTSCKDEAKYNFMTVHGSGDFFGKMEGGGGEEGFYDEDDKPSNEGFYLDENGVRQDAALFADDDDYVMGEETQLMMIKGCRDSGTPESVIKSTYPDYYTLPEKA